MTDISNLPFEVHYERVKQNLIRTINRISETEQMPPSIMMVVLENVLQEYKVNSYSIILGNYNISIPEGVETDDENYESKDDTETVNEDTESELIEN